MMRRLMVMLVVLCAVAVMPAQAEIGGRLVSVHADALGMPVGEVLDWELALQTPLSVYQSFDGQVVYGISGARIKLDRDGNITEVWKAYAADQSGFKKVLHTIGYTMLGSGAAYLVDKTPTDDSLDLLFGLGGFIGQGKVTLDVALVFEPRAHTSGFWEDTARVMTPDGMMAAVHIEF